MIQKVCLKNGVSIRLTDKRWAHISEEHSELAGLRPEVLETVANPTRVLEGGQGEFFAVRGINSGKNLVVVYRGSENDGFIITAFITSKLEPLNRKTH